MAGNFHESFTAGEVKPPSERSTGLVFSAVAVIVAISWRSDATVFWSALALAGALAAVSFAAPHLLKPLNIIWFKIGLLLHKVVNPIVMFAIFAVVFVPTGFIVRLFHDPLQRQRRTGASSYWIERRREEHAAGSMRNQF